MKALIGLVICLSVGLTGLLAAPSARAEDLEQALRLGLASDPLLREADANRNAALEAKPQARALLLPLIQLDYNTSQTEQDGSQGFFDVQQQGFVNFGTDSTDDDDNLSVTLEQSVFRWDRWVSLRRADATIAQAEANYRAALQDMVSRVAQRYFEILSARDTLDATVATKEAVARQLEQAETRFEVGLIAITDVREAQAAYDNSVADEIAAKRVLGTSKELLREITGVYFDELLAPGDDLPLVPPEPQDVDSWVKSALEQNSNVIAGRLAVDIATEDINLRRTGHYPTLDLLFTHQEIDGDSDGVTIDLNDPLAVPQDSDSTTDLSADTIGLRLNVPIYSGGGVSSRVREAVHLQRAAKDRLDRVIREAERLTRDSYAGVISEISRVAALKKALESSQTALEATEAGFDVGTRTTVDVLIARQNLTRARTAYLRSRYDYLLNVINLKLAAGSLTEGDLLEINGWLR
jgi:outer membrane protein